MAFFSASVGMAVTEAARSSEARTAKHMRELKTILFCRVGSCRVDLLPRLPLGVC